MVNEGSPFELKNYFSLSAQNMLALQEFLTTYLHTFKVRRREFTKDMPWLSASIIPRAETK